MTVMVFYIMHSPKCNKIQSKMCVTAHSLLQPEVIMAVLLKKKMAVHNDSAAAPFRWVKEAALGSAQNRKERAAQLAQ